MNSEKSSVNQEAKPSPSSFDAPWLQLTDPCGPIPLTKLQAYVLREKRCARSSRLSAGNDSSCIKSPDDQSRKHKLQQILDQALQIALDDDVLEPNDKN